MKTRVVFISLVLVTALAFVSGCTSNNNNEWQRLVCSVQSINLGNAVVSAAVNLGNNPTDPQDDYVPLDLATVLFWARAGNSAMLIPDDNAYSAFIVTAYDAVWSPGPDAPPELTDYNVSRAPLSARIPIDDELAVSFLYAPMEMKSEPWYPAPYSDTVYTANLQLVFYGHEEGSEHEVMIPAGTTVTFLGSVSEN